ncbi:MAG: UDP-N-acetylmuramoyl-L-alanyl-D-glutamate--2,6-diaminopimelate ligase, partial [Bacteroidaceae bacterium]|nr:UDP-N-acetylmuramoyl-L-alanyl-D-glutamate--2,6-diaminopimelate ligase [Bacteroidaceae bacterium]
MILEKLISGISTKHIIGETSIEITGINIDSRAIEKDHIFVAVKGTQTDGHTFIEKAIEKGASAIICETIPTTIVEHVTYIQVPSTEDIVGELATQFYGDP